MQILSYERFNNHDLGGIVDMVHFVVFRMRDGNPMVVIIETDRTETNLDGPAVRFAATAACQTLGLQKPQGVRWVVYKPKSTFAGRAEPTVSSYAFKWRLLDGRRHIALEPRPLEFSIRKMEQQLCMPLPRVSIFEEIHA